MTTPMPHDEPREPSAPGAGDAAGDYLWDRSGPVDPLVEQLETVLAASRLQRTETPNAEPLPTRYAGPQFFRASRMLPLAAVLALMVSIGAWYAMRDPISKDGWYIEQVMGAPRADGRAVADGSVLPVGDWLVTDASSSARMKVPRIGSVDVAPNSRLRIETTNDSKHLVYLEHGKIQATINAPPRLFFVDTRAALATDMGCRYDLIMPPVGAGLLTVTLGWVQLDGKNASAGSAFVALVPRGASCVIDEKLGPGTPFRAGARQIQDLLTVYDNAGWETVSDAAFTQLLNMCNSPDGVTLWHLLHRFDGVRRAAVYDRITVLYTIPNSIDVNDILNLDEETMHRLWMRIAWE